MNIPRAAFVLFLGLCAARGQPRVGWTASQVAGSPEPAKAFVAEQILPKLKLTEGLELAQIPGSARLLVVERHARITSIAMTGDGESQDEVLNLLALHPTLDCAYGVALHPAFRETRQIYVCYAFKEGLLDGSRLSRFSLSSLEPLRADPKSEEVLLTWRSGGHNGGNLQFGPDGFLYVSTGDSGPAAPPDLYNSGQDPSDLPASILRLDVDRRDAGKNYAVPPDNPWFHPPPATPGAPVPLPEIWAFGLRNPWKMSFDRATGNLWCGDVGWELWEMVHLIKRGGNYGWSAYEAAQPIKPQLASVLAPITPPVVVHPHAEAASVTGGYVYHGKQFPELANAYIYGDWVTGKIWALWHDGTKITRHEEIASTPHNIVTFGEGEDGELYYLHYGTPTTVHRLVRNPAPAHNSAFPRRLSATGVFADVARQQPAAGVYAFSIANPMWEDGASARRWIALRDNSKIATTVNIRREGISSEIKADYVTTWPKDAVFARTITLGELALNPAQKAKPIETQLLHYDGRAWNAYSYRWNEAGTDAELVPAAGAEMTMQVPADPQALGATSRSYRYRFQSRAECLRCHNTWNNGALAFNAPQLRGVAGPQTNELIDRAIVTSTFFDQSRVGGESSAGPNPSARAVFAANCAHCHSANAGGSVPLFLNADLLTGQMNIVNVAPNQGGLGLKDAKLITPGDPWNSVIVARMAKLGTGHMPLIGAHEVDVAGLKTIEDWIARMTSDRPAPAPWAEANWDAATIERELATISGALRLRRAIDDGRLNAALRAHAFKIAWASPESTVRDIFERFKPDEQRERTLGPQVDTAALLRLPGNAARGAGLVASTGKLAACQACHFIQGQGRHFGPDLSKIGAQQSREQILDSLLFPSKTIASAYRPVMLDLRDGTTLAGFIPARTETELSLTIATGQTIKIKSTDVRAEKALPASLMPEGQLQGLTPQEAADLLAYLASLK